MNRLHAIQYEPLNVVGRNADLVLQARIVDYRTQMLDELLYSEHSFVDGFDKEMCIYSTEEMTERIFGFSYSWEVYTPVAKRKYGYYVLPVIYNDHFVARFEPKPISESNDFTIKNWWWEKNIVPDQKMIDTIQREMERFAEYCNVTCNSRNIEKLEEKS